MYIYFALSNKTSPSPDHPSPSLIAPLIKYRNVGDAGAIRQDENYPAAQSLRRNKYRGAIRETYGGCASLLCTRDERCRFVLVAATAKPLVVVSSGLVLRGIVETCLGPEVMKIQPSSRRRRSCARRTRYVPAAFIEFILAPSLSYVRARARAHVRVRLYIEQTTLRYFHFKARRDFPLCISVARDFLSDRSSAGITLSVFP